MPRCLRGWRYDGTAASVLYLRDVSSQTIVNTSLDEMRRQGSKATLTGRMGNWMDQHFPDMQNGDEAIMVAANGGMTLYHNGEISGRMTSIY